MSERHGLTTTAVMYILVKTLAMPTLNPLADIDKTTATSTKKAIWKKQIEITGRKPQGLACPGNGTMHQDDASEA
jgi:hypothetical protein